MKAVIYNEFSQPLHIQNVRDPTPGKRSVVIKVEATGMCRSDWHGWMGHDPDIKLPHVPGHELAGVIVETGGDVSLWKAGDRVTLPFVCGCGMCQQCLTGNHHVCDRQFQPGFTHWGSFAQFVAVDHADINLVRIPDELDFITAASLGCRFSTSFRAITAQGDVSAGQWVAVHGCGGVGLSAIMIAHAVGAHVVAIDINKEKLDFARSVGAEETVDASEVKNVVDAVLEVTHGGAHVSLDALGSTETCFNSVSNLRKRGKHIQVGLMLADQRYPSIPMDKVIAHELEILGSHGMQAHAYGIMIDMITTGKLKPQKLIGRTISLEESIHELPDMDNVHRTGMTIINTF